MGYKNKNYKLDLHQQMYNRLVNMQAFGESKKEAIRNGTDRDKIFSFKTFSTYKEHCGYFIRYIKLNHPECTNLKQTKTFVREWLQLRVDQGLSAWTLHTETAALRKLFGMNKDDPDNFTPPQRKREDIKRSRTSRARDKHFSVSNNDELIRFCKGVGARREGMIKMKGKDLRTKQQIKDEVKRLIQISKERKLTKDEYMELRINKEALLFFKHEFFVYIREKGGRKRISPIVGPDVDQIVARFRRTSADEKVWLNVSSNADIHGYRSDFSNICYKAYAREIEEIPYKTAKGTGRRYRPDVYFCRKDEKGCMLDKKAMKLASIALGHSRLDVIANNYLRGL